MPKENTTLRARLHRELESGARQKSGLSPINTVVAILIGIASLVAILESEPLLFNGNEYLFFAAEAAFTLVFGIEYAARMWAAGEEPQYAGFSGRIRYALSPMAIIDLLALLPLFLLFLGSEAFILRLLRLIRILRLGRLGRFSQAMAIFQTAIRERCFELLMSCGIAVLLLIASSTLLYTIEGGHQPEAFGSIPRAMWWSIATLTTVGYGDIYPVTTLGRIFAGVTAITGIGLIAMPAGILASAFSDAIQPARSSLSLTWAAHLRIHSPLFKNTLRQIRWVGALKSHPARSCRDPNLIWSRSREKNVSTE